MMLARSAERIYWAGRYLERAENTARIVQQYSQMLLDLPDEVGVNWPELLPVFGVVPGEGKAGVDESAFMRAILSDRDSPASLIFSLRMARENVRNNRDLLPMESWESLNELYHFVSKDLENATTGEDRFEFLAYCIAHCQQVFGCLHGTMSHHSPYHFLTLGQHIERADMTSRVIDFAAAYVSKNERVNQLYGSTLWTNLLKTVGGFQMYRQYVQPRVSGTRAIEFLVSDAAFPRAIHCCVVQCMLSAGALPNPAATINELTTLRDLLATRTFDDAEADDVRQFMDELQLRLARVHSAVADTWFLTG